MPAAARSYQDPCGIARALDLVGERWALLVVRELLHGPKRFTQLRHDMHDASANVLTQRLRELTQAGVVRRYALAPPASVPVYELTERGRQLESVLIELGRWGSQAPITSRAELSLDALLVALKTTFDSAAAADLRAVYELRVADDTIRLEIADAQLSITRGSVEQPTATVAADAATLRSVLFGDTRISDAVRAKTLAVDGDRRAVNRLAKLFPRPAVVG